MCGTRIACLPPGTPDAAEIKNYTRSGFSQAQATETGLVSFFEKIYNEFNCFSEQIPEHAGIAINTEVEGVMDEKSRKYNDIQIALTAVNDVLEHITAFNSVTDEEELNRAMPKLLASLGRYSMSERAYIFSWASEKRQVLRMTHEWCADGVSPTIDKMQDLKMSDMPNWAPRLNRGEAIISMDWDQEKEKTPQEYEIFDGQNIHSLIVIPIFASKRLNGYIGFDNPEHSMTELSVRLLTSVGIYIGGLKENLLMTAELEEKQRSLEKSLEEQKKEKIKLEHALADAKLNSEIIGTISKIYWLIYRMDLIAGTYEEISAGREMHRLTGKRGNTAEVFRDVRETVVCEEHQDMMETFLDTSTLQERLKDTESVAMEYRARSGSWHLARFIAKRRDENGRVTNVLYVVRQIDRQKQKELEYKQKLLETAEDARRANMVKTDFMRRMSHDIRTPINGIQGMVAIAEHYAEDGKKQKECREKVKEASGFLLDLVNSILDMNKLESGRVVLEYKPFHLIELLNEINNIIEMNAELKGLTMSINHEKVRHEHLIGSPLHLKQILQNIAGNAVKYNRSGGTVSLSTEEISCENGKATYRFICSDTGKGMSEEFLTHAFEPFMQEESSVRSSYMGTGLGLAIAKQLVEMMGGTIEVKSTQNVGTTFTMEIPFEIETVAENEEDSESQIPDEVLAGVKVLLAEDNDLNLEIAEFILENAGMSVTVAKNGQEAVALFQNSGEHAFDLILMDIMMPVMDGLTATKKIRNMERADAKTIPIFAMTANAFAEDVQQSREAGMNEHLSKPLDAERMLQTIKQYVVK